MLLILNGACGVGKTKVSWALLDSFYSTVMMDADYICATNPFILEDSKREEYLNDTILKLIIFHRENGYKNFIIANVYENPDSLQKLLKRPELKEEETFVYRLTAEQHTIRERIIKRNTNDVEWELKRFVQLEGILNRYNESQAVGRILDTTNLSFGEVVYWIKNDILKYRGKENKGLAGNKP
ncbi:MAG: hypothetical protein LBT06_18295 [Hungatella sp.]|nr:hypothetical protein [Hungatella sp.]MDR1550520.1 hypothetical protein [Hungatella sp.]MDR2025880.1 hypothetical protein [Hungatella sp.]